MSSDETSLLSEPPSPPLPPVIPSEPPLSRAFSPRATVVFAVLAVALFFLRNWPYLSGGRLALFWYPDVTISWVVHQQMLLHEGAQSLTRNKKMFLTLTGLQFDGIPDDCEKMLRETIADVRESRRDGDAEDELRARLAVLLAETGTLTNAINELAFLGKSDKAVRFQEKFRSVYANNRFGLTLLASKPEKIELLSGWAHWRFTARAMQVAGDREKLADHERSIRWEADQMLWRSIIPFVSAWLVQMVGLICLARLVQRKYPANRIGSSNPVAVWSTVEHWGLFVRACLYGLIAEHLLAHVPWFGYTAWLAHSLVFGLPVIVLLSWRHWRRDPRSFGEFFGIPATAGAWGNLASAFLALFAICWLSLLWAPAAIEALGFESSWAEGVDDVLLTWPWSARVIHLADGILFAPLVEETVFRGLLYGALRTKLSPLPAAGASAVIFAATHFYSLPGFVGVSLFGFWCAVAREKTGSLLPGIATHMLTNLFLFGGQAWLNL